MSEAVPKAAVCVVGAAGRMGRRVARLMHDHPRLVLATALERPGAAGEIPEAAAARITDDPSAALSGVEVVIDVAAPPIAAALAPLCADHGVAYLVASTGLGPTEHAAIDAAARRIAVLHAANLSLGVNVLLELVELAAHRLAGFDVEIAELHHRHKRDAPSGTALALGQAVERGRGALHAVYGRQGLGGGRPAEELGYAALRGGDVAGEHTVFYFGAGERLELTHRAQSADVFARGALVAAAWLVGRPAGLYAMRDVLAASGGRAG